MTCKQIQGLLAPFVGGQLDAGRHRAVELHVEQCAVCAKELAELRDTIEAVHSLDPMPVPAGFVERVRASVEARSRARFRIWAWAAPLAVVAALALGLGVLAKYVQPTGSRLIAPPPKPGVIQRDSGERERTDVKADSDETKTEAVRGTETVPSADEAKAGKSEAARDRGPAEAVAGTGRLPDGLANDQQRAEEGAGGAGPEGGPPKPTWSGRMVDGAVPRDESDYAPADGESPLPRPAGPQVTPPTATGTVPDFQPAPGVGTRPTLGEYHATPSPRGWMAPWPSAATAGERANAWARTEVGQSQLALLAENNFALARREAGRAADDAPIVVAALAGRPAPDRGAALTLNVQSLRRVRNAAVTLENVSADFTVMPDTAKAVQPEQDRFRSQLLWQGELDTSDVKAIPLAPGSPGPAVQRADIVLAATEAPPAGAAAKARSEVVDFVLFVPADLGQKGPAVKRRFNYVRQPLDVVFGDLAGRSGLALLVRHPYGRVVDFQTPAVTGERAIRMLAEQQGYLVVPDSIAWTLY